MLLLLKSIVKTYTKRDGTVVQSHSTKVHAAPPKAPPGKPAKAPAGKGIPVGKGGISQGLLFAKVPPKPPSYPNAIPHPKLNDEGKPVQINEPSAATAPATWTDPKAIAVFTPGGEHPPELNGVALAPWEDHPQTDGGWEYVDGQMPNLVEPPMQLNGKAPAAGVVIEEPDGRVWIIRPSNAFAGYKATFPKGHADDGMSLQATAIKECFEESGLKVQITGLVGDVERIKTVARYYTARRVGGSPTAMGWETQACVLVPKGEVHNYLNTPQDRAVADKAGIAAPAGYLEAADGWEKVGKQAGSNPGGVYVDPDGQQWYVKVPKSPNIARNEVLAAKLYEAAGVAVPELKHVTMGGDLAIASKIIPGLKQDVEALKHGNVPGVMDGFAVDAWLANWDAVGLVYDNLLVGADGAAVRVDVGGSLVYRAQGEPKGAHFGVAVNELDTMTGGINKQASAVFGHITLAELAAGAAKVASVSDDQIRELCAKHGPGTKAQRAELADKLIARKVFLKAKFKVA